MYSASVRTGLALTLGLALAACSDAPTASTPAAATPTEFALAHRGASDFVAVGLGDLGGGSALARKINRSGVVVGSSMTASGEVHAFVWNRRHGMQDLGTLRREDRSDALAINRRGEIVGTSGDRAVLWDRRGRITPLHAPGAERSAATDISASGMISGWAVYPPSETAPRRQLPVIWNRSGRLQALYVPAPYREGEAVAVNDAGVVAATVGADISHVTRAAVWRRRSGWHLLEPQVPDGRAVDMNLSGDVVGVDLSQPFNPPPILWRHDGSFQNLSPLGGDVRGINTLGSMAGRAVLEENGFKLPVMWTSDLSVLPLPVPDDRSSVVNAISDHEELVGGIGAQAVIWTRNPGSIRSQKNLSLALSKAAGEGSGSSLPAWLQPEHQRCTRNVGPLQPGEPVCGERR